MRTHEQLVCAALVGAMVMSTACDRGSQGATQPQQRADDSEAAGPIRAESKPDAAEAVHAAYHAVLDASTEAQAEVVAEHGRAPLGPAGVLRYPDFDAAAAGLLSDEFGLDREEFASELAVARAAAAAMREAGVIATLAGLARAMDAVEDDATLDLSGTFDGRVREAYRMLACLAVDAELGDIGSEKTGGDDAYVTVIAGLDAMARAQLYAVGDDAATASLSLLRFTDSLILDAIAAGHMSQERARALMGSAIVATGDLRERYRSRLSAWLPPESREAMAAFCHATRDARRLALAIEVYRARHGGLPESLDDLVPVALADLPRDPHADDGRYAYRLDAASPVGYVLYSVGPDGVDDGGVRTRRTFSPEPGADLVLVPDG